MTDFLSATDWSVVVSMGVPKSGQVLVCLL